MKEIMDQSQIQGTNPDVAVVDGIPDVVSIETVDQFAMVAARWHAGMLARLRHMRDVPHGTEVTTTEADGSATKVKLKGDGMKGFQAGLNAAMAELDAFPFVMSTEEVADDADASTDTSKD